MKKLILATGAIYGVYMLLKRFNSTPKLAMVENDIDEEPVSNELGRSNIKAKEHNHGDIRKLMKKASSISHHLEEN